MEDLANLQKDLHEAKENLSKLARMIKESAVREVEAHCEYEEKKNQYLIILYDEEVELKIKRTGDQRKAMYRGRYKNERREWLMAKADLDSNKDLFKGLQSKINALQTLISLEKAKMNLV